jgi:hypothetical protein
LACRHRELATFIKLQNLPTHFVEDLDGQSSVSEAAFASDWPDIGTGPAKAIYFADNDPRRCPIETEMALDSSG